MKRLLLTMLCLLSMHVGFGALHPTDELTMDTTLLQTDSQKVLRLMDSFKQAYQLEAHPSPATDNARIHLRDLWFTEIKVKVINLNGRIERTQFFCPGSTHIDVDLSQLTVGTYRITIEGGNGFHYLNVIKAH
jgi:hypothetical protein